MLKPTDDASADNLPRELAYQAYINEMTPNGNSRIDNFTVCAGPDERHQRHIATQVDLAFQAGWAAAMLRACKGDALALLRAEHAEWSARQFGDVSAVGPAKHLSKEALEVAAEPLDAIEHADCWMLLWDMQRRAGISDAQLASAIAKKLAINKARSWPAPKEGEAREHKKDPTHDPRPTCKTCGHPAGYCGQC
jgi:hypothetical protein